MATDESAQPAGAPARQSGRRVRRQNEIRQRLLAAGRTVFMRYGVTESTIAQITQEADVGFGTFYLYFPTKEALYRAVVQNGFAELGAQLGNVLQDAESAHRPWRTTVTAGVDAFYRFAEGHRDLFALMFVGPDQGGAAMGGEMRARVHDWATAVVRAAAQAECVRHGPADEDLIDILTVGVIATLRRTTVRWMRMHADTADTALPPAVIGKQVGAFIAAGLAAAICMEDHETIPGAPQAEARHDAEA